MSLSIYPRGVLNNKKFTLNSQVIVAPETCSHAPQGEAPLPLPGQQVNSPPPGGAYRQYSPYAPPQSYPAYQSNYGYQGMRQVSTSGKGQIPM